MWVGARSKCGYGQIGIDGRTHVAHKITYEMAFGPVPDGLELDHLCRVRACVRPDHLEAVTHAENCRRGDQGKHLAARTHCVNGHEYTADNMFLRKGIRGVTRICRECGRTRWRDRWAATKHLRAPAYKDRTHCPQGHPYAGENLHITRDGSRCCRACGRIRALEAYRRKAAALRATVTP